MQSHVPCSVCGEAGHNPSRCKSLRDPLKDGFQGGGGGGGGHDEDDEHCKNLTKVPAPRGAYHDDDDEDV